MKKALLLTLTFAFASTFTGCNKDDNETSTSTSSVIGKWKTVKFDYYTNGQLTDTETTVEDNINCPDNIEFKNNGTYISLDNDEDCNSVVEETGTYVFNGTTLTTDPIDDSATTVTVLLLNGTDMKIDLTETASDGTVFKNIGYFKKIN